MNIKLEKSNFIFNSNICIHYFKKAFLKFCIIICINLIAYKIFDTYHESRKSLPKEILNLKFFDIQQQGSILKKPDYDNGDESENVY